MKTLTGWILLLGVAACKSPPTSPVPEPPAPAFSFAFSNFLPGDPGAEPPISASVYVKIVKSDGDAGQVEWSRIHREGDRLGWDERSTPPTSVHRVFSRKKGRTVAVDFDSGNVITSIYADKLVPIMVKRCPVAFWPARCPGPEEVKAHERVNEVTYSKSKGKRLVFQKCLGAGPPQDLCVDHGGERKGRPLTDTEVLVRKREVAALLAFADDRWLSRNPKVRKHAQEAYRKLLKDHRGYEPVPQNLDRIKARAEAEIED